MDHKNRTHIEDEHIPATTLEGKDLLTAEDLLRLQIEDDPFMLNELNLCSLCSWTSSQE
ncbi:MAG TPA: hypothetical protein VGF67_12245 [Ktedonobacteraceae bacterium]|jgi:hypothetical protein